MHTFRFPPVIVTLTKRLVYVILFFARPLGVFFFSCGSTYIPDAKTLNQLNGFLFCFPPPRNGMGWDGLECFWLFLNHACSGVWVSGLMMRTGLLVKNRFLSFPAKFGVAAIPLGFAT